MKQCQETMWRNNVKKQCQETVSRNSVKKQCQETVSRNNFKKQCQETISRNSVKKQCQETVSRNNLKKQCQETVSRNGVKKQCQETMSRNSIKKQCKVRSFKYRNTTSSSPSSLSTSCASINETCVVQLRACGLISLISKNLSKSAETSWQSYHWRSIRVYRNPT